LGKIKKHGKIDENLGISWVKYGRSSNEILWDDDEL